MACGSGGEDVCHSHFVLEGLSTLEGGHVLRGYLRDVGQSLLGQERLVRSDEHVREGRQASEYVVLEDSFDKSWKKTPSSSS